MATPPAESRTTPTIDQSRPEMCNARPPGNHLADQVFQGIETCVARAASELSSIKSPLSQYEEDIAKLQTSLDNVWLRYKTADAHDQAKLQDRVKRHHIDLYLLESNYNSNLEQATSEYEQRTEAVVQRLCDKLIATLGPGRINHSLRGLEPQRLDEYLLGDYSTSAINGAKGVRPTAILETAAGVVQGQDKDTTAATRRGVKRRGVNTTDSETATKRPAIAENGPRLSRRQRKRKSRNIGGYDQDQQAAPEDVIPGNVYLVWERSKMWSAVLLLPIDAMDSVGVPETMETLGLSANPPDCYVVDTGSKRYKWRKGYEDGGPRVAERIYPVMDFDDLHKRRARWVAANELKAYDEDIAQSLDYYPLIQEYLRRRLVKDRSDDERTIFVRGDSSHSPALSEAGLEVAISDSEASTSNPARGFSTSEPLAVTRDTSVLEEAEATNTGPNPCAESDQEQVRTCSVTILKAPKENSLPRQADDPSVHEEHCSGRSPSLGTQEFPVTEHPIAPFTQGSELNEMQVRAVDCPSLSPAMVPDPATLSAPGRPLENVSSSGNRTRHPDCSQAVDCPAAATVQESVSSALCALDGTQEKVSVSGQTHFFSLPSGPAQPVANPSRLNDPVVDGCINTTALSNEPQGPQTNAWGTQSQLKSALPHSKPNPPLSPRQLDGVQTPSQAVPNLPQHLSSHILPPSTEPLGHQRRAMHEMLPPLRTLEQDMVQWPAKPVTTGANIHAGPVRGEPNLRAMERDNSYSIQAQSSGQPASAWEPSLDMQIMTPRNFHRPTHEHSGGWPADFPQVLVRELEGVLRRRNGLPSDFSVSASHFRYGDNKYHCPFCSAGKWKVVTDFFEHLKEFHCSAV